MKTRFFSSNLIFQLLIFIILFYFVFELNYFRHWSSIQDQDLTLIHNSLLLNSGSKAEYHDHPGHTQILFMSLWLNFLKLLNIISVTSYQDFEISNFVKKDFIKLVQYSRFINLILSIVFAYTFYNIFKIIIKKKILSYLLTILLITSYPLLISISHIRTELISTTFIFLSFLYLLKTIKSIELNRKYIFLIGFFFTLSIFGKFQSIFIFLFYPFLLFIAKKKIIINLNNFEKNKLHIITSIIFILAIFLIWKKYVRGLNYIFLPMAVGYFYLLINYINNKYIKSSKFNFIFLFYFLFGISCSFFLIFIPKPFHTNNINVIVNFFSTSSMYIQGNNMYTLNFTEVLNLFNFSITSYLDYLKKIFLDNFFNELFLLLFSISISFFFRGKKIYTQDLKIITSLFVIIFVFSVRPQINYIIYFIPIIYLYFVFSIERIINYKIIIIVIILLTSFNIKYGFAFANKKKFLTDENRMCSPKFLNEYAFFYDKMRLELFPQACKK